MKPLEDQCRMIVYLKMVHSFTAVAKRKIVDGKIAALFLEKSSNALLQVFHIDAERAFQVFGPVEQTRCFGTGTEEIIKRNCYGMNTACGKLIREDAGSGGFAGTGRTCQQDHFLLRETFGKIIGYGFYLIPVGLLRNSDELLHILCLLVQFSNIDFLFAVTDHIFSPRKKSVTDLFLSSIFSKPEIYSAGYL